MNHPPYFLRRIAFAALLSCLFGAAAAQESVDYTALGDAAYSQRLGLSDQQIAEVSKILDQRRNAIVAAKPEDRANVLSSTNQQLADLLSDAQRSMFSELVVGGKLRFSFRNESWADVLDWFAAQSDLALVMNEAPTGGFTYSDSKNHTPTEAIDLLNSVLQSKGFTLVRREKMLIVSRTSNGIPYDQVPKVKPEELSERGRFEYVSVLFPLEGRPVEQVTKEVAAFLGTNGQATPLPTTGQLMVVDTAGRVDAIRKLIDSIPKPKPKEKPKPKAPKKEKPKPPPPVFRVHSAAGLNIDRAMETLKTLYGDAKLTGDSKAEQITAFTPAAKQDAIAKTLAQMTSNVTGDNEPRLQIYPITDQDVDQLRDVVAQANPGIQVSADSAGSRLLVVGDVAQHSGVQRTLETLDAVEADDAGNSVAVYDVKPALVDQIVELLKPLIPRASVVANAGRIAVRGNTRDQQIAKSAILQLDAAERNVEKPTLRFLNLKAKLESQYLNSIKQLVPEARITEVPGRRQLAVVATNEDHQRVLESVQQIEAEVVGDEAIEMHRFEVAVDDPNRLLSMLKRDFAQSQMMLTQDREGLLVWASEAELVEIRKKFDELSAVLPAKRAAAWQSYAAASMDLSDMQSLLKPVAPDAQFKPEPQRKRLMVWATQAEHEKITTTLAAFQGDDVQEFEDVLLGYPLNRGDPASVVEMLRGMRPDIKFAADERANRILVTAPLAEQARIKAVIDQLDTAPGKTAGDLAKSYDVKSMEPSTIVGLLQPTLPRLRMTPNDRQNKLAVVGPAFEHEKLKKAIEQLDGGDNGKVVAYNVGSSEPWQVRSILQQLIPGIVVSISDETRSVIVWASDDDHAKVKQAVEQFSAQSGAGRTTEIYRFDRTNNRSAESVFRRLAPRARVSVVYGTNSVIASATAEEHELLREAAGKMNGGDEQSVTKVYALDKRQINVDDVLASIDDTLKSRLALRMNEQTNSLMVRGSEEDQRVMQQLIDEITAQIPAKENRVPKIYELTYADPDTAEFLVRDLYPDARFSSDDDTGTLAATALPEEHTEIAKVIEQLDVPGQSQRVTEVYRFDRASARAAENAFERLAPRARVSFIYGTNSVIATATEADHKLFREAAEKMNGGAGGKSVTRVYPLDKEQIDVEDVLASIDDTLRSRLALRMNEQTNSLMVRGSPEDQATMKQLLDEIIAQVPPKKKRVAKIYQFEHADPDEAEYILRDLFEDGRFTGNDETGTLAVTALPEEHEQIAEVVKELDVPGQQAQQVTEIYRFDRTDGRSAEIAFERLVPRARVSYVRGTNSVIATGSPADHELFREAAAKMNGGGGANVTKVYPLDKNQIDVEDVLASIDDSLKSRLAVRMNEQTNSLMVRGSVEDQAVMKELIDQIIEQVPPKEKRLAKVYQFRFGNARSARYALRDMFDDATITSDDDTGSLIATATEEEHEKIASIVQQMDQPRASGKITKIYRLESASAVRVYPAIRELVDDGRVSYDNESNALIVTTSETEHVSVDQAIKDLNGVAGDEVATRVYELKTADANNIRSSLERLMPQLRVASDIASGSLIVAANEEDHSRVQSLVSQLDAVPGQESRMKAYVVKSADAQQVYQSLSNTFNGNGNFSLSFQEATKTIFVVATPRNHEVFSELMEQLDTPELSDANRTAKTYPLNNLSPASGRAAITALLKGSLPAASVEIDELGNSLILIGTDAQHEKVAGTLGGLSGAATELEVFDLDYVDPWTVESAVDTLFMNQPASASPTITSDYFSPRIFVRGSKSQIEQIRGLLRKMGETSVVRREAQSGGDVRTIPFDGDVNAAILQLQQVWPRVRQNRIQVVAPSAPSQNRRSILPPRVTPSRPLDLPSADDDSVMADEDQRIAFVALQTSTRAPAADSNEPDAVEVTNAAPVTDADPVAEQDLKVAGEDAPDVETNEDAPVVIVPGADRITIASSDHEALNQLEELLRVMSRVESDDTGPGSDFAVFLLRNTGASDMRQLLGELFDQLRKNSGVSSSRSGGGGFGGGFRSSSRGSSGGYGGGGGFGGSGFSSLFGPNFGNVAVVADDRLNALIIHGDRQERELIEELLSVLDTKDLPNPIVVYQPELIRLQNTQADRVLGILQNVYRSQLQSGGGRKKVEIPEGVGPEVAGVLQQINAAAGAPILTLDVDDTTNSIVMRAPPEIRQEITAFVQKLDSGAGANRSRNVRVIRLERGKSDRIRDALEQFILERGGSR